MHAFVKQLQFIQIALRVKQFFFSGGSWLLGTSAQLQVRQPLAFVFSLEQGLKLKLHHEDL